MIDISSFTIISLIDCAVNTKSQRACVFYSKILIVTVATYIAPQMIAVISVGLCAKHPFAKIGREEVLKRRCRNDKSPPAERLRYILASSPKNSAAVAVRASRSTVTSKVLFCDDIKYCDKFGSKKSPYTLYIKCIRIQALSEPVTERAAAKIAPDSNAAGICPGLYAKTAYISDDITVANTKPRFSNSLKIIPLKNISSAMAGTIA